MRVLPSLPGVSVPSLVEVVGDAELVEGLARGLPQQVLDRPGPVVKAGRHRPCGQQIAATAGKPGGTGRTGKRRPDQRVNNDRTWGDSAATRRSQLVTEGRPSPRGRAAIL